MNAANEAVMVDIALTYNDKILSDDIAKKDEKANDKKLAIIQGVEINTI